METPPESEKNRAQLILTILRDKLVIREEEFATLTVAKESHDTFRILVVTVLTQNCTDKAALHAYRRLDQEIGVTPQHLARANVRTIEKAIRVAGLYRQKARGLKKLAQTIAHRYEGDINPLLSGSLEEARVRLTELPRVGPKTADVLLGILGRPTISVDTHVNRVSKRLGLAPSRVGYEKVRGALMQLFREEDWSSIPLYFMTHGRRICRARRPLCPTCPVEKLCPYPYKTK